MVIDYYADYWQDIVRDFKLKGYQDIRDVLHYAMDRFIEESAKSGPLFLSAQDRNYLKEVHKELKEHYLELWDTYRADPHYLEFLKEPHKAIQAMRKNGVKPPLTYRDLVTCLGACEAYMLIVEEDE